MAFQFITSVGNSNGDSGTTLDMGASLNLAAGDVLVIWVKWEGAATTVSVAKSTGSPANTFTFDAGDMTNHSNNDLHGILGYLLAASADASATMRVTWALTRPHRRGIIMQFRPDSLETVTKDASNIGSGTSAAPQSGVITTTGTDEIAVGGYGEYSASTTSSELINGAAATEPTASPQNISSAWYSILTATFTGGRASATIVGNEDWICNVIALKSVAADVPSFGPRNPAVFLQAVQRAATY